MSDTLEKNLETRAKDLLGIEGDIELFKLYLKVKEYRNQVHPDNFQQEEAKKEANEKFKLAQNILEELGKKVEREKLKKDSTELSIYDPIYEQFGTDQDLENAQKKISELKEKIDQLIDEKESIENKLQELRENKLESDYASIEENYKPSTGNLASLGIAFLLTSITTIFSKVEELSSYIFSYSPLDELVLNRILFGIFVLILLGTIKKYAEHKIIKRKASQVRSPKFAQRFTKYIKENNKIEETFNSYKFYESDVFKFIGKEIISHPIHKILAPLGFQYFQDKTINLLKDIFIDNLLNKKLVKVSDAKNLDRLFLVNN